MPRPDVEWQDDAGALKDWLSESDKRSVSEDLLLSPSGSDAAIEYWRDPNRQRLKEWFYKRLQRASVDLEQHIECDPQKAGGVPVVKGTRLKVAQLLAELAEGQDITEIAEDLDVSQDTLATIMKRLAVLLDQPFAK